jgi:hypothetical protein
MLNSRPWENIVKWDEKRKDLTFFPQSASLECWYFVVEIDLHRPHVLISRRPAHISSPSVEVCTNAARKISEIISIHKQRTGSASSLFFDVSPESTHNTLSLIDHQYPTYYAAIVLLLMIISRIRVDPAVAIQSDLDCVRACLCALKENEARFSSTGRYVYVAWLPLI